MRKVFPRPVVQAGVIVGLAIMGDSLLYNLLPLEATRLGFAPVWVGVLLSANRLIRLVSNVLIGTLFARWGPRLPFLLGVLLAVITTFLYGVPLGIGVFLLARVGWGIAWSALRQGGYQTVWAVPVQQRARMMGMFWGLVRLGSAVSVLVGGYVRDRLGYGAAIALITGVTMLALPLAWRFPWPSAAQPILPRLPAPTGLRQSLHSPRVRWILAAGLAQSVLEATLVSTTAPFIALSVSSHLIPYLGTATGVLLAVRWLSDMILGPIFGALADRIGTHRLGLVLTGWVILWLGGTLFLQNWWRLLLFAAVLMANAGLIVALAAAANTEALHTPSPHLVVAAYTTAVDIGLAVGPLVGYTLGVELPLSVLYFGIASALGVILVGYRQATRRHPL